MRKLHLVFAALLSFPLLWMNIAVHTAPMVGLTAERERLQDELRYLQQRVHDGVGDEMQRLFPEGSDFTHALYGLAWCGLARSSETNDPLRQEALREAMWALAQMDRPDVQARFATDARPKFGVFHAGWRNMLLGRIVEAEGVAPDTILLQAFTAHTAEIADAFATSSSPYLESYPGKAWPADAVVAMASLGLYDRLVAPVHHAVIARWLTQVPARSDERGMIPHAWDPAHDRLAQDARGSSQALINTFLPMIDTALATDQYLRYRLWFLIEPMGLPVLREHPQGMRGPGDADSGPVLFGVGGAATLVNIAATRANDQPIQAHVADAVTEALCFGAGGDHRRYLFGTMPMADLFIAWGRSVTPAHPVHPGTGFKQFHLWSITLLLLVWSPTLWRMWRRHKG